MTEPEWSFQIRSALDASSERVWNRVTTMAGINDELWPFLRMTSPAGVEALDLSEVPLGRRLFRSWILLFGILPIDYDDLTLVRIEAGRGFLESSRLLTQRRWEHERTIEAGSDGCVLTDRIRFEPRMRAAGPLFLRLIRLLFVYRHRRLRRTFGGRPT